MKQIKFKKIALNISFKQYEKFKQLAQEYGLPYSELIRRALDKYLEGRQKDVSHDTDKYSERI